MANKRTTIGSICKRKDGTGRYLKISKDVLLKKDEYINIESKNEQLASLKEAVAAGRLSPEVAEKLTERLNNLPDFVMFEVIKTEKQ